MRNRNKTSFRLAARIRLLLSQTSLKPNINSRQANRHLHLLPDSPILLSIMHLKTLSSNKSAASTQVVRLTSRLKILISFRQLDLRKITN
jgi:hypothetical protein